jgi:hypothetical protein
MDKTSFLYVATQVHVDTIHAEFVDTRANLTYRCDECKQTFTGREVVLKPFRINISFCTVKLVQDKTTPISICDTCDLPEGHEYYTMHCPRCGMVHLFGFDLVE